MPVATGENMLTPKKASPNRRLSAFAEIGQSLPEYSGDSQVLSFVEVASRDYQHLLETDSTYQRQSISADYAQVCWTRLTGFIICAGICQRMDAYAGECWRLPENHTS